MKNTNQIAKECGVDPFLLKGIVKKENIKAVKIKKNNYYNQEQENLIVRILYFEGKTEFLTLESKMNYES